jgi:hypothetical protein
MPRISDFKVIVAFVLTSSMIGSPLLTPIHLSVVNIARGIQISDPNWYPAGPSMDHLQYRTFANEGTELTNFPTQIDFEDTALTPSDITNYQNQYVISQPSSDGTPSGWISTSRTDIGPAVSWKQDQQPRAVHVTYVRQ